MKEIKIKKVFNTVDELNNSEEYKQLWEGFHMDKEKNYPDNCMVKAYVAEDDTIYTIREMTRGKDAGLKLLHKVSICASLNSSPFMVGTVIDDKTIVINNEKGYDRCMSNRVILAKHCQKFDGAFVATTY